MNWSGLWPQILNSVTMMLLLGLARSLRFLVSTFFASLRQYSISHCLCASRMLLPEPNCFLSANVTKMPTNGFACYLDMVRVLQLNLFSNHGVLQEFVITSKESSIPIPQMHVYRI